MVLVHVLWYMYGILLFPGGKQLFSIHGLSMCCLVCLSHLYTIRLAYGMSQIYNQVTLYLEHVHSRLLNKVY